MKKQKEKTEKSKHRLSYLDYECRVGERVRWENVSRQQFEGVIIEWKEDSVAVVKLDNGTIMEVKC